MKPTLGTQLRHLLELLDGAVEQSYRDAGLAYRPRYTPVVRALIAREPATIGEIAEAASISQPAVTQTIALMTREGLVASRPGTTDGRQRLIRLTDAGRSLLPRLQDHSWVPSEGAYVLVFPDAASVQQHHRDDRHARSSIAQELVGTPHGVTFDLISL